MLEGRLVRLRAHRPSDLDACLRWMNDVEVLRTSAGRYPVSPSAEAAWLERVSAGDASGVPRDVHFGIDALSDGRYIGNCSIERVSFENRSAEVGIMIGEKDCWDRGYGTDAMRTMLRFAFREMNLNRIQLDVFDFNARAISSYRKCGFVEEGRRRKAWFAEGSYHDIVVMGVLRDEFEAAPE
ncbi:MAG TPA: GNAT family protein [Dehalococcoidia bacterium]|nr:GNAT family protein [Dehalococcoidia bacterium]